MISESLLDSDRSPADRNSGPQVDGFQYRPLDHKKSSIRLIRILPELSSEGYIRCEMWHATIESQYQCLSYLWGALKDTKTVLIQDTQSPTAEERPCQIHQNLHAFLVAARGHVELVDPIWIDALCIDQGNGPERNHQVTQMGKIYSQSSRVIVWLGNYPRVVQYGEKGYDEFYEELARNDYWQRAWITQEFVLPRHIDFLINSTLIPYSKFRVVSHSQRRLSDLQAMRNRYENIRNSFRYRFHTGERSLSDDFFLLTERHVRCTVPRDRIFSLLSLLKEGKHIPVDYSMPVPELAYRLLKLYTKPIYLSTVFQFLSLIRDEQSVSEETIGVSGHFVEFQTFFAGTESRATTWVSETDLFVVDKLLCGRSLQSETMIRGKGFMITRRNAQSLMLNVRVAISVLSGLLGSYDPWSYPYLPVVEHPSFDMEIRAWADTSPSHFIYTRIFGRVTERTWIAWSAVKIGYEPTPNRMSIPYNLVLMGLSLGWGA